MKLPLLLAISLLPILSFAQSNFEKTLKAGEFLMNGLVVLKGSRAHANPKTVELLCVKNKMQDKITFHLIGKDEDGKEIKKELIIIKDSKECLYELPKGVWDYEILLNNQVYKKGQYRIDDSITITIKDE